VQKKRRANGVKPREQYLAANSISATKPWRALGMGRSKWYKCGKPSAPNNSYARTGPSPRSSIGGDTPVHVHVAIAGAGEFQLSRCGWRSGTQAEA
jgi:hypothetical protein